MRCDGCNGIIGRDCFNPIECLEISRQMDNSNEQQNFEHIEALRSIIDEQKKALQYILDNNDGNFIVLGQEAVDEINRVLKL